MSNSSRVWLLQSRDKYFDIVIKCLNSLRETDYFSKFYVATNRSKAPTVPSNCDPIFLPKDFGWSNNIIKALDSVEEDIFFMGCEDHLLVDLDKELVDFAYKCVSAGAYGCVRLTKKHKIPVINERITPIKEIDKSYRYYVSLQPSVWSKDYLKKIIRPNESSWQFEILASQRAKELDPPAGVTYKTAFNYRNLIKQGKLVKDPKTYTEIHG